MEITMYWRLILFAVALVFVWNTSVAQDADDQMEDSVAVSIAQAEADAIAAADHWLAIVDEAAWLQSHTEASQLFKSAVAPDLWVQQISAARTPFGPFISRTLTGSQYATSLPGAPDGEYVVLTYQAKFKNKANATETVTPMKDSDGTWRVSGYYIK
ncbi:DUF4019 domain-containing protein [Bacteroidota bacterium]